MQTTHNEALKSYNPRTVEYLRDNFPEGLEYLVDSIAAQEAIDKFTASHLTYTGTLPPNMDTDHWD